MRVARIAIAQLIWVMLIIAGFFLRDAITETPLIGGMATLLVLMLTTFLVSFKTRTITKVQKVASHESQRDFLRLVGSVIIWIAYLIGVINILNMTNALTAIIMSLILIVPSSLITLGIWGAFDKESKMKAKLADIQLDEQTLEKRKRDRIDHVLRDLSDDDLVRLRRRLQSVDEEDLYQMVVGDDGELLYDER